MKILIWTPTRAPLSFSRDNFCFYRENFICVSAAFGSVLFLPCCSSLCAERALAPERDAKAGSRWKEKFYGAFLNQRSQIMLLLNVFLFIIAAAMENCPSNSELNGKVAISRLTTFFSPISIFSVISKGQTETNRYRFLARHGGFVWIVTQATVVFDKQKPQSVVCVNFVIRWVQKVSFP